jgi:hypothetical protein
MRRKPLVQSLLAALVLGGCALSAQASDWLQFGYDATHSNYNNADTGYSTPGNALLFHATLSAPADSAAIYLSNVQISAGVQKNLLFIGSLNGTLMAVDADTGVQAWSQRPSTNAGISTGSPIVDPSLQYVYAYAHDGKVHKYRVADGTEITAGGWPETSTLKTGAEKGASALSIGTSSGGVSYLYSVTDGYVGDGGDYQGHITAINLNDGTQKVFNSSCSNNTNHFTTTSPDCAHAQSGIWGRPGAIYDPGTNRVFFATGNGLYDAVGGAGFEWGDSLLALNIDGTGSSTAGMPIDSYTPSSYSNLQGNDADLGSTSPAILPSVPGSSIVHLGIQGGKDGCVRLLNLANLSGAGAPAHVGGELQAVSIPSSSNQCTNGDNGDNIRTAPAIWTNPADKSVWAFYITSGGSVAYKVTVSGGTPSLTQQWSNGTSGTSPIVANGVLYFVSSNHVRAVDAASGTQIWDGESIATIKWQSPILVNGRLYVIDQSSGGDSPSSSQIWVFQLDGIFRSKFE